VITATVARENFFIIFAPLSFFSNKKTNHRGHGERLRSQKIKGSLPTFLVWIKSEEKRELLCALCGLLLPSNIARQGPEWQHAVSLENSIC
jgi:hypothetical protein